MEAIIMNGLALFMGVSIAAMLLNVVFSSVIVRANEYEEDER